MYEKTLFHSWFYFFGFYLVYSFICLFFFFENNGSGNLAVTSRFKLQKYHNIPRLGRHKSLLVTKDPPSFLSFLLSHCLPVKLLYQSVGSSRSSMFFVLSLSRRELFFEFFRELFQHVLEPGYFEWEYFVRRSKRINISSRESIDDFSWFIKDRRSVVFWFSWRSNLMKEWSTVSKDNINLDPPVIKRGTGAYRCILSSPTLLRECLKLEKHLFIHNFDVTLYIWGYLIEERKVLEKSSM